MHAIRPARDAALDAQQKAYAFIKNRILTSKIKPGEQIVSATIAQELGVSRTPVREALSRLEQETLVRRDTGWGFTVRPMTLEDILDLYRVRDALETEAVKEAVERADAATFTLLDRTLVSAKKHLDLHDVERFLHSCRVFHAVIAKATRNTLLQHMLSMINDRVQIISATILDRYQPRALEIYAENRKILKALEERDAVSAIAAVREHISKAGEYALHHLARSSDSPSMADQPPEPNRTRRPARRDRRPKA